MTTFGADITAALREMRAHAESLMVATVRITRLGEVDRRTGLADRITVYEGRGKVQTYEPYEADREVTGGTWVVQRYHVHVPVTAGPFENGDLVEILTSPLMPHQVGDVFRVAGLHEKTMQTAQRLLVDEITNQKAVTP